MEVRVCPGTSSLESLESDLSKRSGEPCPRLHQHQLAGARETTLPRGAEGVAAAPARLHRLWVPRRARTSGAKRTRWDLWTPGAAAGPSASAGAGQSPSVAAWGRHSALWRRGVDTS
eukprot:gene23937-biopygen2867